MPLILNQLINLKFTFWKKHSEWFILFVYEFKSYSF